MKPRPSISDKIKIWTDFQGKNIKFDEQTKHGQKKMLVEFANMSVDVIELETVLLYLELLTNTCDDENEIVYLFLFSIKGDMNGKFASSVMFNDCLSRVLEIIKHLSSSIIDLRESTAYFILLGMLKFICCCKCICNVERLELLKGKGVNIENVLSKVCECLN